MWFGGTCWSGWYNFGSVSLTCPQVTPPFTYNYITKMCERSSGKLTITLSGTTTEPWHKKHDPEHSQANLPYKAIVKDQNGQPKTNIGVTITTDVTSDSGGHVHTNNRPKGKLVAGTGASTKAGKETITGTTNGTGVFEFTFGAEEASGTHTLTAKCDSGCQAPATATVEVAIPDLMQLGANPNSFTLNGSTTPHPNSHYFSAAALLKISDFAAKYAEKDNFGEPLIIIDSSLEKGGVLDLGEDWTYKPKGHQGHRKGIVVDVNNYRTKPNQKFKDFATKNKINAVWEGPDVTAHPHYHLWLLGSDQ